MTKGELRVIERTPAEEAQYQKMTTTPIPRLIGTLAVPTIISMLVTSIYNMADTFFVSQLGTSATGAVGVVFSIMAIIQAVGFTIGMGSGSIVSRLLGQQEREKASECLSTAFVMAVGLGLIITLAGMCFSDPLMRLMGATETILPYARDYASYIFFGAPVMCASFVLNNNLRAEGRAFLSMIGLGLGGVLNIALDPLFIFTFGLGISGAAIATLISQCVSMCILLFFFLSGKSVNRLNFKRICPRLELYGRIIKTGFPSFCRQGLASIATIALNVHAAMYGDPAVAAMSIVGRTFMLVLSVMIGFGQGFQPVVGYNFGAQKYGRVRQAFRFSIKIGVIMLTCLAIAGFVFAPQIMAMFRKDDPDVIAIGTFAFRAQCIVLPLQPLIVISNMMFQSLGKSFRATFISASRQGIFFLPLIFILPRVWGLTGVQITQTCADILTFLCCIPFVLPFMRELKQMDLETQNIEEVERTATRE